MHCTESAQGKQEGNVSDRRQLRPHKLTIRVLYLIGSKRDVRGKFLEKRVKRFLILTKEREKISRMSFNF